MSREWYANVEKRELKKGMHNQALAWRMVLSHCLLWNWNKNIDIYYFYLSSIISLFINLVEEPIGSVRTCLQIRYSAENGRGPTDSVNYSLKS
jgi:hypothetical protein